MVPGVTTRKVVSPPKQIDESRRVDLVRNHQLIVVYPSSTTARTHTMSPGLRRSTLCGAAAGYCPTPFCRGRSAGLPSTRRRRPMRQEPRVGRSVPFRCVSSPWFIHIGPTPALIWSGSHRGAIISTRVPVTTAHPLRRPTVRLPDGVLDQGSRRADLPAAKRWSALHPSKRAGILPTTLATAASAVTTRVRWHLSSRG